MNGRIRIVCVVGARPNFMKIAPLMRALTRRPDAFDVLLLHTGQHSDEAMSDVFFADLDLKPPEVHLGVTGGTHGEQTGRMLIEIERVLMHEDPSAVAVVGDVNSSLAGALAAAKLHIPVAHIEAGLRSRNRRMPEELNRVVIDHVATLLFVHEESARANLVSEGIAPEHIFFVGNIMVDTLCWALEKTRRSSRVLEELGLSGGSYGVVTLHRPENVDDRETLERIIAALAGVARRLPLVWPIHPRTQHRVEALGIATALQSTGGLAVIPPLGYLDFVALMAGSRLVLTDSGGVQEETTALRLPCITLRDETERPVTVSEGTNVVVGTTGKGILAAAERALSGEVKPGRVPDLWDGRAAERIVAVLERELGGG